MDTGFDIRPAHTPDNPSPQELERNLSLFLQSITDAPVVACVATVILKETGREKSYVSQGFDKREELRLSAWSQQLAFCPEWNDLQNKQRSHPDFHMAEEFASFQRIAVPMISQNMEHVGIFAMSFDAPRLGRSERLNATRKAAVMAAQIVSICRAKKLLELDRVFETRRADRYARLAEVDPLTSLENAGSFKQKAKEILARSRSSVALIVFDVDQFKIVNDTYGHRFGDTYLREIGAALARALPQTATIGRVGGDEFAALVPIGKNSQAYLDALMEACQADVQRMAARHKKSSLGHISMGAAIYPRHAQSYKDLYDCADAALYAVKSSGKHSRTIFNCEHHDNSNMRLLKPRFLQAIRDGKIIPHFQPILDLGTKKRFGFEVLARWQDPSRGLLTPSAFSSVFRESELSNRLTRVIFEHAFCQFASSSNRAKTEGACLSLNVGTDDLGKSDFVFEIQRLFSAFDLEWRNIIIEVKESARLGVINGPIFQNLAEIRSRGGAVALDDFGTGYSGLTHLRHWPVDIIKIDRSFVTDIEKSKREQAVPRAMIDMAKELDIKVVAEGIEKRETLEILCEMGCDYGQGFYIEAPNLLSEISDA